MVIEIAVGTAVSWLWGKLADAAEAKDHENAIKKALQESIDQSFNQFQNKYGDRSESFFNQEFIESHACPEILKYLTRHQQPDLDAICQALPVIALFSSESGFKEELEDFFVMIRECMKSHAILQEIINYRQIEETNQIVKDIQEEQKEHSKSLDDGFNNLAFHQVEARRETQKILSQHTEIKQQLDQILNLHKENLPASKGDEVNKLLAKQLDKTRDLINNGQVADAKSLLELIEDEVKETDDYTRFRWHTNQGSCLLSYDERKEAAKQYLIAYNFAKNEEKAVANKIRALLLMGDFEGALKESESAIQEYSLSGIVWAFHINAKSLLNKQVDQSELPEELQHEKSVLLILSDIKFREKAYKDSYKLAKDAFQQDESSIDAKRAMLASTLSWVTADTVKSYYKQLAAEQLQALKETVDSFGDILSYLKTVQSKHVFSEVAHNLAVAAELLGDDRLKDEIIKYAFSMHPDEEAFIWQKVKELKTSGDIDSIHKLTDDKLNTFEKPLLFTIAEVGANTGDASWVQTISQELNTKELNDHDKNELFGLELCANWKGGNKLAALDMANDNLQRIKSHPALLSFYIRMLDEHGDITERDKLLQTCRNIHEDATSIDIIQTADLLYDFDLYFDASELYKILIESPSNDHLTKRYIDSLIKSDQRAKASSVFDQLDPDIRNKSTFKRIEANLARASGDLNKLEEILSDEIRDNPSDSYSAVGYIATLYRKKKFDELDKYLSMISIFDPVIEQNEIEIAKYEMDLGYQNNALLRLYSLFRSKPGDSEVAGHFLLLMLLAKDFDSLKEIQEVAVGTAVYLQSDNESKNIVIEPERLQGSGWAECVSEKSDLAKHLLGLKIGDEIELDTGIATKQWKTVKIDSMFIFASSIAQSVVANSASSAGPLWSVNVQKSDGEFDFTPILESLKKRSQRVEYVFGVYEEKKLPLQMLAKALGTDIVTLFLEWPYKKYDLFVSSGLHNEQEDIKAQITRGNKPYVVDLTALIEFHTLGLLKESLQVLGKPLIASSLKEHLQGILQIHNKMEPSGVASEIDGKLHYQDIPQAYLDDRSKFLNELIQFIDNHCDVVPVVGPESVTELHVALEQHIGLASNDTILLSLERSAILVTEDGGFRALAVGMGVETTSWLQPILMIMRDQGAISESQYSQSILSKLERRHNFTSVAANDLLWSAKPTPNKVSAAVESAIDTFKSTTLDLPSGVVVGSQFLAGAVESVSPAILRDYYNLIIESLSYGREQYTDNIHEALRSNIVSALPHVKNKKANLITRKFGRLLDAPPPRRAQARLKPLTHAIRLALRQWQ